MKDSSFKVVHNVYKLISLVDLSTVNVPNRERKMLDKLEASMFDLVEIVCTANNLDKNEFKRERLYLESMALSKLNVIDFLVIRAYSKGYIGEKKTKVIANQIEGTNKLIKGWMNFEKIVG